MKPLLIIAIICSLFIVAELAVARENEPDTHTNATNTKPDARYAWKVNWNTLDQGIEKSRDQQKPMIVDFAVHEGCDRCDFLQENVYSKDLIVSKINKDFVPIFINLAEDLSPDEQALGHRHDFHDDCMLLFLDHDKQPVFDDQGGKMCFVDEIKPEVFIRYLDYVIGIYEIRN